VFRLGKSETPIRVKDCGLMRGGHMDLGIAEGAKAKAHREIGDREFMRTGTHVVGDHETPTPEASIGRCARWTHEEYHVPAKWEYKTRREARKVGPDDVVESDVDPHERTTCHGGEGRQLCCGPGG
jgi:hypothetical protein